MNFNQLEYFLAIVKAKTFSGAALDLYISQSSISKQIKALEDLLGVTLFKREHSKVVLTPAGEVFLSYAQHVMDRHNEMLSALEPFRISQSSTIKMGSIPIVAAYGVANQIATFTSIYENQQIVFDMHESSQSTVVKELQDGTVDIALVRIENLPHSEDYDVLPYVEDEFVMVCSKKNALAAKKRVSLADVASSPLMLLGAHSSLYTTITNAFKAEGLAYRINCATTRHKILLEMLAANTAVSLLPARLFETNKSLSLVAVKLEVPLRSRVVLVKQKKRPLNQMTKNFWSYWAHIQTK